MFDRVLNTPPEVLDSYWKLTRCQKYSKLGVQVFSKKCWSKYLTDFTWNLAWWCIHISSNFWVQESMQMSHYFYCRLREGHDNDNWFLATKYDRIITTLVCYWKVSKIFFLQMLKYTCNKANRYNWSIYFFSVLSKHNSSSYHWRLKNCNQE